MPFRERLVNSKFAGFPVLPGEMLDPAMRFILEIVEDCCLRETKCPEQRGSAPGDLFPQLLCFLQAPGNSFVVEEKAVPVRLRTVGERLPTEKEETVRSVSNRVPAPKTHLSRFRCRVEIVRIAIENPADLAA